MNLRSDWPDATAVHAALAPTSTLLAERRTLYHLAFEIFTEQSQERRAERLDNPLFRYRIGEALAGRTLFAATPPDDLVGMTTELTAGDAGLRLVSSADANDRFAHAMRVIHAQSGGPGAPPRLLTEADGEAFARARGMAEAGLRKAYEVSPRLAEDLLPHTSLLAILDPATSGGLVSASSRLFPGLILIDQPSCAYDVAEALVHEGAHQKFFDLAITHDFLGADLSKDRIFHPSWSGASWPVEQVIAAFHAYACMAQFGEEVLARGEAGQLGPTSLLLSAREREAEIGEWLLGAEDALERDARWFLRTFLREETDSPRPERAELSDLEARYALAPLVRVAQMAAGERVLLARLDEGGQPPQLHWLRGQAVEIVEQLSAAPRSLKDLGADHADALARLLESSLVLPVSEKVTDSEK
ncbi:HEXXH motif domain-containing protein [Amycolatopsis sp. K13G38]|uniref:HEXXH motif domain-containing protein n=1 Tax=Amycolatopsis acididurans TaxID=2724524 RepID=A0ABX1J192_9PSEU|nr:HEXXH motif-containing putative peptide modification protein [Amycolatopsis acididurans]NKQ53537.1 HEXXH motif domain-containing protein [Amycolatopsis acididurans]